jgi:hypothetical protein
LISLLAAACGIVVCAAATAPVPAAQLNVTANECQPFQSPPENFGHSEKGVFTLPEVTSGTGRDVICSVPRVPDTLGGASFYVDGDNLAPGAFIDCVIMSLSEDRRILAQVGLHSTEAQYDMFVALVPAQVDPRGSILLACLLPPQGQGILRGVTSLPGPAIL